MLSGALAAQAARLISVCGAGGKTTLISVLAREFAARGERVLVTTTTRMASDEGGGFYRVSSDRVPEIVAAASRLWDAGTSEPDVLFAVAGAADGGRKLRGLAPETVDALRSSGSFDRVLVEADGAARRPLKACAAHEPVVPSATDLLIAVAGLNALRRPLCDAYVFRAERWASLTGRALGAPVDAESIALMAAHCEGFFRGCPPAARRTLFLNRAETPETRAAAERIGLLLGAAPRCAPDRVAYGSARAPSGIRWNRYLGKAAIAPRRRELGSRHARCDGG